MPRRQTRRSNVHFDVTKLFSGGKAAKKSNSASAPKFVPTAAAFAKPERRLGKYENAILNVANAQAGSGNAVIADALNTVLTEFCSSALSTFDNELIARQTHEYHRVLQKDATKSDEDVAKALIEYATRLRYVLYLRNKYASFNDVDPERAIPGINEDFIAKKIMHDEEEVKKLGGLKASMDKRLRKIIKLQAKLAEMIADGNEDSKDKVSVADYAEYKAHLQGQLKSKASKGGFMGIVEEVAPLAQPFLDSYKNGAPQARGPLFFKATLAVVKGLLGGLGNMGSKRKRRAGKNKDHAGQAFAQLLMPFIEAFELDLDEALAEATPPKGSRKRTSHTGRARPAAGEGSSGGDPLMPSYDRARADGGGFWSGLSRLGSALGGAANDVAKGMGPGTF